MFSILPSHTVWIPIVPLASFGPLPPQLGSPAISIVASQALHLEPGFLFTAFTYIKFGTLIGSGVPPIKECFHTDLLSF